MQHVLRRWVPWRRLSFVDSLQNQNLEQMLSELTVRSYPTSDQCRIVQKAGLQELTQDEKCTHTINGFITQLIIRPEFLFVYQEPPTFEWNLPWLLLQGVQILNATLHLQKLEEEKRKKKETRKPCSWNISVCLSSAAFHLKVLFVFCFVKTVPLQSGSCLHV